MEPLLTNIEPTVLPKPRVKSASEPVRAEDVPAAFMRAIATALQPPAGPVFFPCLWTTGIKPLPVKPSFAPWPREPLLMRNAWQSLPTSCGMPLNPF